MAESKKFKPTGKVISDVAKPGKSAPASSAKPIIVSNRPLMQDPMMVDDKSASNDTAIKAIAGLAAVPSTSHITIDRPAVAQDSEEVSKQSPSEPKEAPVETPKVVSEKAESVAPTAANDDALAETSEPEPTKTESTKTDAPNTVQANDDKILEAEVARAAELQKLIDDKTYYLPINQVEKRRARRYVWAGLLLIILLAVIWTDVALDAHLITIPGVKPVTHFFSK